MKTYLHQHAICIICYLTLLSKTLFSFLSFLFSLSWIDHIDFFFISNTKKKKKIESLMLRTQWHTKQTKFELSVYVLKIIRNREIINWKHKRLFNQNMLIEGKKKKSWISLMTKPISVLLLSSFIVRSTNFDMHYLLFKKNFKHFYKKTLFSFFASLELNIFIFLFLKIESLMIPFPNHIWNGGYRQSQWNYAKNTMAYQRNKFWALYLCAQNYWESKSINWKIKTLFNQTC